MIALNKDGRIKQELLDLFKKHSVSDDELPYYDDITHYGYNKDWNIIGGKFAMIQFSNHNDVVSWLIRLSMKLFHPEIMIPSSMQTDHVQLRIAVTMIDKLKIPDLDKYMLFENLTYTYWLRKDVYNEYYFTYVNPLPF